MGSLWEAVRDRMRNTQGSQIPSAGPDGQSEAMAAPSELQATAPPRKPSVVRDQ
jgi:hypothetical protein